MKAFEFYKFNHAVSKKSPTSVGGGMNYDKHGVYQS